MSRSPTKYSRREGGKAEWGFLNNKRHCCDIPVQIIHISIHKLGDSVFESMFSLCALQEAVSWLALCPASLALSRTRAVHVSERLGRSPAEDIRALRKALRPEHGQSSGTEAL